MQFNRIIGTIITTPGHTAAVARQLLMDRNTAYEAASHAQATVMIGIKPARRIRTAIYFEAASAFT